VTTAESFENTARPPVPYLRAVPDDERAPRLDLTDDEFASFARAINDARGWDLIPVEPSPVELTEAHLWARIARLEEDREVLSGRCDDSRDRLERNESLLARMRDLLRPAPGYDHDSWYLRGLVAQLRDLLS
jgi:hypothetical protein